MIGVPIEMPETCEACLCNVHECYCGVTGNFFNFDETTKRADDCPLVDLSGEHVPVNNVGNIDHDGTLTVTVPKGTEVGRVLVQEEGTQFGGLYYAD
jgi:hypothetical protein